MNLNEQMKKLIIGSIRTERLMKLGDSVALKLPKFLVTEMNWNDELIIEKKCIDDKTLGVIIRPAVKGDYNEKKTRSDECAKKHRKRKLLKVGGSFFVTLPKKLGWNAGDSVKMVYIEHLNSLAIARLNSHESNES